MPPNGDTTIDENRQLTLYDETQIGQHRYTATAGDKMLMKLRQ
jgi:hypothetical protein